MDDLGDQQIEVIDAAFSKLRTDRQLRSEVQLKEPPPILFSIEDLQNIRKDFLKVCNEGELMDYDQFRTSLGLLGAEDFFARRLFAIIDLNGDQHVGFEEYSRYLDTIFNGTTAQKSLFGWRMIAGSRSFIEMRDMYQVFYQIAMLWKTITGEIINLDTGYLEEVFNFFDLDQDQAITFEDYQVLFEEEPLIFGWYEFLNNKPLGSEDLKKGFHINKTNLQNKRKSNAHNLRPQSVQENELKKHQKQELIKKRFGGLCQKLKEIAVMMRQDQTGETSSRESRQPISPMEDLSSKIDRTFLSKPYDTVVVLRPETLEDREEQQQYQQLFPNSDLVRSFRSNLIIPSEVDPTTRTLSELKQILERISILQGACHQFSEMEQQDRLAERKKKELMFKYQYVSKQLAIKQSTLPSSSKPRSVYFGHHSWNLVLNLMIGLRKSIKSLHELNHQLELKDAHFDEKYEFLLTNRLKKPHCEYFKFCEFAPLVFEKLRFEFGITNEQYHRSVGPESFIGKLVVGHMTALSQKCSTGRSGSFFYQTHDNKYLLKTIPKKEFLFLRTMLRSYYEHMAKQPNSLIVRICGVYKIKRFFNGSKQKSIYFISMENIFAGDLSILERYDLKGSSYGRKGEPTSEFKDNDWVARNRKIELDIEQKQLFVKQLTSDAEFFSRNNINDYSFLVGIAELPDRDSSSSSYYNPNLPVFRRVRGGCMSRKEDKVYLFSIIDIFTEFNSSKSMEYLFKRAFLGEGVSCIPPLEYSQRFVSFITEALS